MDSALVHAYEHIVIQIKNNYRQNILKGIAKTIIGSIENNTYNIDGRLRVCILLHQE